MSRVSVVMAVYNGSQFVEEQLESIVRQTRKPDEVIILDDCSTDDTKSIVQSFIKHNKLDGWKLVVNKENIGWRKNFMKGFELAGSDIIFCADQDDIWDPRKIEVMGGVLDDNQEINVLACNLTPLYEHKSSKLSNRYCGKYGTSYIQKVDFNVNLFDVPRPGCCMCFRKTILPVMKKLFFDNLAHDSNLWLVGTLTDSAYVVNESLVNFRRHGSNNSPSNAKNRINRSLIIGRNLDKALVVKNNRDLLSLDDEKIHILTRLESVYTERLRAVNGGKLLKLLAAHIKNRDLYSLRFCVADIVSSLNK